ncbi:NUDIX hydrolase [Acetobacter sp.]|jgi:hypothetical protein|uniref:NUDIX hydrolase n=1 Tax=Acetobacter sp. TaxID=440 RepID=UPI0025C37782|nr:hypothetical protein [Acetobacter sp.]MCH4090814.1 hypothetical protein [Acetobacter sp.]MCI1300470.1 hypothetical protein [Acetobacter sp.]MCI1316328.1 hypothetical protein [Acetobacter sp.]
MNETAHCRTELVAVVLGLDTAVTKEPQLRVLTTGEGNGLPSGPLQAGQASLQRSLRHWVENLTGFRLGYTEQLYTFADAADDFGNRAVRISYMALARSSPEMSSWQSVYRYFPWEDRRSDMTHASLIPLVSYMKSWMSGNGKRLSRCSVAFGLDGHEWNDELVLDRYELLWEAGLLHEAGVCETTLFEDSLGHAMKHDHRRILATALSRIRAKIRYTPAVFDFLPQHFTLLQLQQAMETLAGRRMHKQNFRRLVQHQSLVEETDLFDPSGQGRPARLYRFCEASSQNCYLAGAKLPLPPLA